MANKGLGIEEVREKLRGKVIHIIPYMHPDWAWCHTRIWHEIRYGTSIAANVDLIEELPEYRFYLDCWRTVMVPFLDRHPQKLPALRRAVSSGKAAICGTFSNVRPNMVDGEAYIRNMAIGRRLWHELFPEAELSVHADAVDVALGHPQMPQLLTKAGYRYYRAGRPFDLLQRKGYPRNFVWKGLDGSEILTWIGIYGGIAYPPENIDRIFVENWAESVESMYELELKNTAEASTSRNLDIHQGCDDCLPLRTFNTDTPIPLPKLISTWNARETSTMRFSTPVEFFHALEAEGSSRTLIGTLDPCDVSYNVAWGGESGLVAKRIRGGELLAAAERLAACAFLAAAYPWQDATERWKENLTASAHATQWLYECDIGEILESAERPITFAREQLRGAARSILRRIGLPRNAVVTAFNPFGQDVVAPLVFTVTCGEIDRLRLADGEGRDLPYQVVRSYEYTHTIWEYDVALMLRIPAHGWNTVIAVSGSIDCRRSGEFVQHSHPEIRHLAGNPTFSVDNGRLNLGFEQGNLTRISDHRSGSIVRPPSAVPWNQVSYVRIDTTKGVLHCGPILERQRACWERFSVLEGGPVRWLVRLWGRLGDMRLVQDIRLHASDNRIYFITEIETDEGLEGYLTFGIPGRGDTLCGGINFGMEKKAVLEEQYFAHDDPSGDMHRLRDGLFFAKDFAFYEHGSYRIMLAPKAGDRYFLFDKTSNELAYIHLGTTRIDEGSWERNVNALMRHAAGRHRFEDLVAIQHSVEPTADLANLAYASRLEPILVRPVFSAAPDSPLGLTGSLLRVDASNVQISAAVIDGDSMVVRLWEGTGAPSDVRLTLPGEPVGVRAEDFIGREDAAARASMENGKVRVTLRPWEIVTLRCRLPSSRMAAERR